MEGNIMTSLPFSQGCPPVVNLLVSVVEQRRMSQAFEVARPLAEQFDHGSKDVCCFSLFQIGADSWRLLTTHGSADIKDDRGNLRVSVCRRGRTPREHQFVCKNAASRNQLMYQWMSLPPRKDDFPYPTIKDLVLFCGDCSLSNPAVLLGLQEIFTFNGASTVAFATPSHRQILKGHSCKAIALRPIGEAISLSA